MKTREQILFWLDRQPWKDEFYKNHLKYGINNIKYNKDFVITAFSWGATKQGYKYWAQIDKEYLEWYNTKDIPNSYKEYVCDNIDKAFIEGYNTAISDAASWFYVYLKAGNTFGDWVKTGMEKYFTELGE